jgi:DNA-binding CsgD family transcriptional regulator
MFFMFGWFSKKRIGVIEEETKKGFSSVKKDLDGISKWIKHLHTRDKHKHTSITQIIDDLSTLKSEIENLKEHFSLNTFVQENKQLSKKPTAIDKQTAVYAVQKSVQTAVQTANFYDILQGLSANERVIVFALMNAGDEMKLSYEDIARLLGKERSTVRGQINSIKQKREGLIQESLEQSGKKRIYISEEIKEKLSKYAKVRAKGKKRKDKKYKEESDDD